MTSLVLDRDLPGVHGDDVCRKVRAERPDTGILMLTAAASLEDLVEGLSMGADDYLPKPFRFAELVARVRALSRRSFPSRPPVLTHGEMELDPARRTVTRSGQEVSLARKEFGVLEALMEADGAAVSAEQLLERVWDEQIDPFTNVVRMTIMTLRRKLGEPADDRNRHRRRLPDGVMRRLRLPAPTVRLRLTALYGALFLDHRRGPAHARATCWSGTTWISRPNTRAALARLGIIPASGPAVPVHREFARRSARRRRAGPAANATLCTGC